MAREKNMNMARQGAEDNLPTTQKVDPASNELIIDTNMKIMSMPLFDLKTATDEETVERVTAFFDIYKGTNIRPPLTGLCLALGIDRRRVWEIANGDTSAVTYLSKGQVDIIKKAHKTMEILWETYLENGKTNPIAAIFLGKNYFGYKDQTDVVVAPGNKPEDYSAEDIAKKYALQEAESGKLTESAGE